MPKQPLCSVEICAGRNHNRRAVAFLRWEGAGYVNAFDAFSRLDENAQKYFRTSFDYWVGGDDTKTKRYHGWSKSEFGGRYTECFVFRNPPDRLYGFLCHPKAPADRRFLLCVLVSHTQKHTWKTNEADLRRVEAMRRNVNVQDALNRLFAREVK